MVYHLHNLTENIRIRFKAYLDINKPIFLLQQNYLKQLIGLNEKRMIFMA